MSNRDRESRPVKQVLAYNLKFYRGEKGYSQRKVATLSQLSLRLYQKLEAGEANPTLETLHGLCTVFQINHSTLLKLKALRLEFKLEEFGKRVQKAFRDASYLVGYRNLAGEILWGNKTARRRYGNSFIGSKKVNLVQVVPEPFREMMGFILNCEENGIYQSYVVPTINKSRRVLFYRFSPIVIYPPGSGSIPTAILAFSPNQKDENEYFEFCVELLKLVREAT